MAALVPLEPVDYLVVGHVTEDILPTGRRIGGTVTFSALTARAFGLRVGIVTSVSAKTSLSALAGIPLVNVTTPDSTTFENIHTASGRRQVLRRQAAPISLESIPEPWRRTAIVHLGPVAQELPLEIAKGFSAALLGITPQGWMRTWDDAGQVSARKWEGAESLLALAGAVIISREDIQGDDEVIEAMAQHTRVLAVTESAAGVVLYWNGDRRRFRAPETQLIDDVGAGDVFAAAFFIRLYMTRDPWEAARFATLLAARSVTRPGLEGVPTPQEIEACGVEVLR
jgi:sugar/nucleoside kinase (ribokinase family)